MVATADQNDENILLGGKEMNEKELKKIIDSDRKMYYRVVELNDKLYIHYCGFRRLGGLEKWAGLKVIYGECNAFSEIEGLENCGELRSLFLAQNCIREIKGLENNHKLWSINLSENFIRKIENLSHLKNLNTLIITKNQIGHGGLDDVIHLRDTSICTLDIQNNSIDCPEIVEEVLMKMPDLRVLYLKGNPVCKKIKNYRKYIISKLPNLKYLDDRPVFPEDRRYSEAFCRGGLEAERAERRLVKEEKEQEHKKNMEAFQKMIADARAAGAEKKRMQAEDRYDADTDPVVMAKVAKDEKWKKENAHLFRDDVYEAYCKKNPIPAKEELEASLPVREDAPKAKAKPEKPKAASPPPQESEENKEKEKEEVPRPVKYDNIWEGSDDEMPEMIPVEKTAAPFLPWAGSKMPPVPKEVAEKKAAHKGWAKDYIETRTATVNALEQARRREAAPKVPEAALERAREAFKVNEMDEMD